MQQGLKHGRPPATSAALCGMLTATPRCACCARCWPACRAPRTPSRGALLQLLLPLLLLPPLPLPPLPPPLVLRAMAAAGGPSECCAVGLPVRSAGSGVPGHSRAAHSCACCAPLPQLGGGVDGPAQHPGARPHPGWLHCALIFSIQPCGGSLLVSSVEVSGLPVGGLSQSCWACCQAALSSRTQPCS